MTWIAKGQDDTRMMTRMTARMTKDKSAFNKVKLLLMAFILLFRMIAQTTRMNHTGNGHHSAFIPKPAFMGQRSGIRLYGT